MERSSSGIRRLLLLLMLVVALVAAACGDDGDDDSASETDSTDTTEKAAAAPTGEPILIGVVSAETGPASSFNPSQVRGLEFWADQVNADGGIDGRPIELMKCDDKSTPEGGASCARDLKDKVSMLVALGVTGSTKAVHQTAPEKLVLNTSPNVLPAKASNFFQVSESVDSATEAVFNFAVEKKFDAIGVIAATDASGEAAIDSVNRIAKDFPKVKVVSQRIEPQDIEASGQIAKLQSEGVDMLFASYSGAGAASVVQAYSNLGVKLPLVINSANTSNEFMKLIEPYRPNPFYGVPSVGASVPEAIEDDDAQKRTEEFFEGFEKKHDHRPDPLELTGAYVGDVAEAVLVELGADFEVAEAVEFLEGATIESFTEITFDYAPDLHVGNGYVPQVYEWIDDRWALPAD